VGRRLDESGDVIEINWRNFAATQKFGDVTRTHQATIVIDDVQPPCQPRGIEIRLSRHECGSSWANLGPFVG
jgi:pyridoxamine 5'-phosphate oxidase family protein